MANKNIQLHPLKSDGTPDTSTNLYPITLDRNLRNEQGQRVSVPNIPDSDHSGQVLTSSETSGVYVWTDPSSGSGNVSGPSSSVNNNFASFNGITGKVIKDSGYSPASFTPADYIQANTGDATANLSKLKIGNIVYSIGAEQAMIYKGTLGTGGDITDLPSASSSNAGWTYVVITAGTYAEQSASVGDSFISNGTAWNKIPMGGSYQSKIDENHKLNVEFITGLANVATSGSYSDLSNQPTLQQLLDANDKTLTSVDDSVPLILKGASTDAYLNFKSGGDALLGSIGFNTLGELVWVDGDNTSEVLATETFVDDQLEDYQPKLTAGNNVTITNNVVSATDTTYSVVTQNANGLMSKEDKAKLDSITVTDATRAGLSTSSPESQYAHVVGGAKYITLNEEIGGDDHRIAWFTFDNSAVSYETQSLDSTQKAQARTNIGAADNSVTVKNNENGTITSGTNGPVLTLKKTTASASDIPSVSFMSGTYQLGKIGVANALNGNKPVFINGNENTKTILTSANFTLSGTVLTIDLGEDE